MNVHSFNLPVKIFYYCRHLKHLKMSCLMSLVRMNVGCRLCAVACWYRADTCNYLLLWVLTVVRGGRGQQPAPSRGSTLADTWQWAKPRVASVYRSQASSHQLLSVKSCAHWSYYCLVPVLCEQGLHPVVSRIDNRNARNRLHSRQQSSSRLWPSWEGRQGRGQQTRQGTVAQPQLQLHHVSEPSQLCG